MVHLLVLVCLSLLICVTVSQAVGLLKFLLFTCILENA